MSTVLYHGMLRKPPRSEKPVNIVQFQEPRTPFSHYTRFYPIIPTIDRYPALESYLDGNLQLPNRIAQFYSKKLSTEEEIPVDLIWHPKAQEFHLRGLTPGETMRINYSYFPLFKSSDGTLYRGSGERIFFVPDKTEATISYSIRNDRGVWLGWLTTVISVIVTVVLSKREVTEE